MIDDLDPVGSPPPPRHRLARQLAVARAFARDHRAAQMAAAVTVLGVVTVVNDDPSGTATDVAPDRGRVPRRDPLGDQTAPGSQRRWMNDRISGQLNLAGLWSVVLVDLALAVGLVTSVFGLDRAPAGFALAVVLAHGVTVTVTLWKRGQRRTEHERRISRLRAVVWPSSADGMRFGIATVVLFALFSVTVVVQLAAGVDVVRATVAADLMALATAATAIALRFGTATLTIVYEVAAHPSDPPDICHRLDAAAAVRSATPQCAVGVGIRRHPRTDMFPTTDELRWQAVAERRGGRCAVATVGGHLRLLHGVSGTHLTGSGDTRHSTARPDRLRRRRPVGPAGRSTSRPGGVRTMTNRREVRLVPQRRLRGLDWSSRTVLLPG